MTISTVVINLDRSPDRLAHMTGEFARVGLAFERFAAVDGADLPESVRPYFCDAAGEVVSPLRPGEVGCYASHLCIWQRIISGQYGSPVLVCVAGFALPAVLPGLLARVLAAAPAGWDLVRLSSTSRWALSAVKPIDAGHGLLRFSRHPGLTGAQLVSRAGAAKLLKPG